MSGERWLNEALQDLAAATAQGAASPGLERRLRRAVRARAPRPMWWRAAAAAVVLAALGGTLSLWHAGPPPARQQQAATAEWFFSEGVPVAGSGLLIRTEVGPETAARFGVLAAGPVEAELIVGDDGLTRAIRFLPTSGGSR